MLIFYNCTRIYILEIFQIFVERLEIIHNIIKNNPAIRFNDIMRLSKLKNGTLTHYISKLEESKKISAERTPRITRFYDIAIPEGEAYVCKYLSRPTMKDIIITLLNKGTLTFPQIRNKVGKSPATISVCLSDLFDAGIITKEYDIPSNKYSLKKPSLISNVLRVYFPSYLDKTIDNTQELLDF